MTGAARQTVTEDDDIAEWDNVTDVLATAALEMGSGEMIHPDSFSLYSAMSAIELMQPKMDVGCGAVRNVRDVELPDTLSDASVIRIMDELLACQATWMKAHTLPQTVFSCAYTQRIDDVSRPELAAFIRIQLATMSLVRTIVTTELVSDEEDFISYNFGFKLPSLSEPTIAKIVKDAISHMHSTAVASDSREANWRHLLSARLKFLQAFHAAVSALVAPKCRRVTQAEVYIELAAAQLKLIQESWQEFPDDIIPVIFDSTFNRYVLANTPPRTAPVLPRVDAFAAFSSQIQELRSLTILKAELMPVTWRRAIPKPSPDGATPRTAGAERASVRRSQEATNSRSSGEGERQPFYSFHCLVHALCCFSANCNPTVLTRSILKRMLLPTGRVPLAVFSVPNGTLPDLMLADIGLLARGASGKLKQQASDLVSAASHVVWSVLRNRGRQRRWLIRSLVEWDEAVLLYLQEPIVSADPSSSTVEPNGVPNPVPAVGSSELDEDERPTAGAKQIEPEEQRKEGEPVSAKPRDLLAGKTPMQLFAHEMSARMMTQHWLLGFECNLYKPSEYAPVFFYIGYVMTTASNATAALADCGMEDAELHPNRYALYLLDQARLWLCRGMFSLLEALELGSQWNYSWRRRRRRWVPDMQTGAMYIDNGVELTTVDDDDLAVFESEELWYAQRFGAMRQLHTGPQFVDYRMFLTLMSLQRDALMDRSRSSEGNVDEVAVRLSDAAAGFRMARDALDHTKQIAQATQWPPMQDETLALARVAITNSVLASQLEKIHATRQDVSNEAIERTFDVSFAFKVHRHFPTVCVSPSS